MLRGRVGFVNLLLLYTTAFAVPAQDKQAADVLDCADPLNSAPVAVKGILDPLYKGRAARNQLVTASERLYDLSNTAGACQIEVYLRATVAADGWPLNVDGQKQQRNAVEWRALNQWLSRLANIIGLHATGVDRLDWKDEYARFAEIYEFKI